MILKILFMTMLVFVFFFAYWYFCALIICLASDIVDRIAEFISERKSSETVDCGDSYKYNECDDEPPF